MPSILGREMASIKYQFDTFFSVETQRQAIASSLRASAEVLRALNLNFQHLYFPFFPPSLPKPKASMYLRHTGITTNY